MYNGWKNWETWNLNLWAMNDEGAYGKVWSGRPYTAQSAESMGRKLWPGGTPDMDSVGDLDAVDWQEIADAWNE